MKNDSTTIFLNWILAVFLILGVTFCLMSIWRTRDIRNLNPIAMQANTKLMMFQSLVNDVAAYNAQAKSPEVAHILQSLQPKTAPAK